jgi:hypothetical protein
MIYEPIMISVTDAQRAANNLQGLINSLATASDKEAVGWTLRAAKRNVSPVVHTALEQIQKEEHAEHCYYKGPVFIELVQDMMPKLHYAPPAYKNSMLNGEKASTPRVFA